MITTDMAALINANLPILVPAFFLTALIYSAGGFGGGSTYSALLLYASVPVHAIPLVSLPCNIVVSGTGFLRAVRNGTMDAGTLGRILLVSVPSAFLGGLVPVSQRLFLVLLAAVLLFTGAASLVRAFVSRREEILLSIPTRVRAEPSAAIIGFVSGIVGIGGGIMLSPVLQREPGADSRRVTATTSGFIAFNSLAALVARFPIVPSDLLGPILILVGTVFVGGMVGSGIAIRGLSADRLSLITGVLLVTVALRAFVQS